MLEAPAAPPPANPPPAPPAANGVDPLAVFKQSRVDLGLDAPPAPPVEPAPPADPVPPAGDPPPPSKSIIPDDVIDPSKPAAPKVHDDVAEILAAELPKGAKKEQIESFGKLKAISADKVQRALDRAAELEAKIGQGTASKAEIDALTEKLTAAQVKAAEIEEQFSKVAYEKSPKFQRQFSEREQTAIDLAKTYLDGTEIKQDIIDLAAHATGRKRVEILKDAGIDDTVIQLISPHLATYDTVQREKAGALNNWKAESQKANEEAQALSQQAKAKRAEQENKVWDTVLSKIDLLPLRKSKENVDWNSRAEQLVADAKKIYNGDGADLPTLAETMLKGRAYDVQQEVVEHLRSRLESVLSENAKLKSAAPGGSISSGTRDGAPVDTSKMSREDLAKSTFNAEKAKAGAA